jgi:catechol 2,3-dioxygenase-like lactoylglutathione lyase family enzyme
VENAGEPVRSISAVTVLTRDMARAVAFYQALGFQLQYGGPDSEFTSFRAGTGFLNLQLDRERTPQTTIWGRVIFWVDDVDAMHRRAIAAGLTPITSPADAPWGERYFHIRDPDGNELSLARPLTDRA